MPNFQKFNNIINQNVFHEASSNNYNTNKNFPRPKFFHDSKFFLLLFFK